MLHKIFFQSICKKSKQGSILIRNKQELILRLNHTILSTITEFDLQSASYGYGRIQVLNESNPSGPKYIV